MKAVLSLTAALLLAGCGGGGGDDPKPVAAPAPGGATPITPVAPPKAPDAPQTQPTPVTPPVNPAPAPAPPVAQPAPTPTPGQPAPAPQPPAPPPPPPQPAEGTYILGKTVKAAMISRQAPMDDAGWRAYENGDKQNGLAIYTGYSLNNSSIYMFYTYAVGNWTAKFPYSSLAWDLSYSNEGYLTLKRQMNGLTYFGNNNYKSAVLVRAGGDFIIPDDFKFILNTTTAEWKGVEGAPWFVQLQISDYSNSNTVFKLCWHHYLPDVRRLSCTLHNKDTGEFRGSQAIDDSRNLGPITYVPVQ